MSNNRKMGRDSRILYWRKFL